MEYLPTLPAQTLASMLDGDAGSVAVVDVRDDDWDENGHIVGALNCPAEDLEDDDELEALIERLVPAEGGGARTVVFHCSLSQHRGPATALRFRNRLAILDDDVAPPKVFVLDGGFERFRATPSCRRWVAAGAAAGAVAAGAVAAGAAAAEPAVAVEAAAAGAVEAAAAVAPPPEWAAVGSGYTRLADRAGAWEGFDAAAAAAAVAERASMRALRRWDEADAIHAQLEVQGVQISDKERTWSAGPHKAGARAAKPLPAPLGPDAPSCSYCGARFASRNSMFKHLKDAGNACGAGVSAQGGIEGAPSEAVACARASQKAAVKAARREQRAAKREQGQRTARHAAAECCLWLGDIPRAWTFTKRLQLLIFKQGPRGVPQPWVKTVVRKAYRSHSATREQLGYAVVAFRDAAEAELVLAAMDGLEVSAAAVYGADAVPEELVGAPETFMLRVRRCEHGDTTAAAGSPAEADAAARGPGRDPPLPDQLRPLTTLALQRRVKALQALLGGAAPAAAPAPSGSAAGGAQATFSKPFVLGGQKGAGGPKASALAQAAAAYSRSPRAERRLEGFPVPAALAGRLLAELCGLRWPAKNERAGLTSERYLVLPTNSAEGFYGALRALCAELMAFVDPGFYYSSIAVTKNFVASPHIDERDCTFQYAVSLGEFEGGELCVDEDDCEAVAGEEAEAAEAAAAAAAAATTSAQLPKRSVAVVNTRNRVARVDGRHIHWVRSFCGGDRYSLIFFDTSDRAPTPVGAAVHEAWQPHGGLLAPGD